MTHREQPKTHLLEGHARRNFAGLDGNPALAKI
jgi:hypothetical protein